HREVVGQVYGLAEKPSEPLDVDALMATMARDKKATSGLTFVLDSSRGLEVVPGIEPDIVSSVLVEYLAS
ncbi:MAG: 3-dehydroquinate synthase, partial [Actinomycetes bacterium]